MRGMRPVTESELAAVAASGFTGPNRVRNRALFVAMFHLGWRISEVLSLTWGDFLLPDGRPREWVNLRRCNRKGRAGGLVVPLTAALAAELATFRDAELAAGRIILGTSRPWPFDRRRAWAIFTAAYAMAGLGRRQIGTHGVRKGHAVMVYQAGLERVRRGESACDPMRLAAKTLGHASTRATEAYLPFSDTDLWAIRSDLPKLPTGIPRE